MTILLLVLVVLIGLVILTLTMFLDALIVPIVQGQGDTIVIMRNTGTTTHNRYDRRDLYNPSTHAS